MIKSLPPVFMFIIGLMVLFSCQQNNANVKSVDLPPGAEFKNLDITNFMISYLRENSDSAMLLDLRTPPEFDAGYIKGAILINFLEKDIDHQLGLLDKSKKYYIYCEEGSRSAKCMDKMKTLGFTRVYLLTGGYEAYKKAAFAK